MRVAIVEGRRRPHGQRLGRAGAERRRHLRRVRRRADGRATVHQTPRDHGTAHARHISRVAVQEARQTGKPPKLLRMNAVLIDFGLVNFCEIGFFFYNGVVIYVYMRCIDIHR